VDDFGQVADGRVELGKLRLSLGLVGHELLTMGGEGLRQALEILLGATLGLAEVANRLGQGADGRAKLREAHVGLGLVGQELLTMGGEGLAQAADGLSHLRKAGVRLPGLSPLGPVEGQDEAGSPPEAPLHRLPRGRQIGGHPAHLLRGQQGPQGLPPLRMRAQQFRQIPQILHRERHLHPPAPGFYHKAKPGGFSALRRRTRRLTLAA
jgi:hypothetical protein